MLKNKVSQAEENVKEAVEKRDAARKNLEVVETEAEGKLAAAEVCKDQWKEAQQLQKAHQPNN